MFILVGNCIFHMSYPGLANIHQEVTNFVHMKQIARIESSNVVLASDHYRGFLLTEVIIPWGIFPSIPMLVARLKYIL